MTPEERTAKQRVRNLAYYAANKEREKARVLAYRTAHPDAVRATKQKYYASDKGKAQRKKDYEAAVASGLRARVEKQRALRGVSEARRQARLRYQLMRRASERGLDEFSTFVLQEAVCLARIRRKLLGTEWHVDHIVPVSKGGDSSPHNIQVVPGCWNRSKSNHSSARFFAHAKGT